MENATKALLIAAGVLIVILLISLGVGVFNTASEQMGNADLSEYQIQQHNDKFLKYVGNNVSGSEVNAMLKAVYNYNLTQEDSTSRVAIEDNTGLTDTIAISVDTDLAAETTGVPRVPTGNRYTVDAVYEDGLIKTLKVGN